MTVENHLERPRFRNDLVAQPVEQDGVRYVAVTDPSSGSTFHFYEVEYSIACAMDGARDLDGLAEWTLAELGIETSSEELGNVVSTLAELGYLEGPGMGPDDQTAVRSMPTNGEAAVAPGEAPWTDETAQEVAAAYDQVMEAEPPPAADEPDLAPEVDLVAEPAEPRRAPTETERALADAMADDGAPKGDEMSFAGLLDDVEAPTRTRPPLPAPPMPSGPAARADSRAETTQKRSLDDEEPTNLPGAHIDDEEDVSVDLGAHVALDRREVQEAVKSSKVYTVPDLPPDVKLEEDVEEVTAVPPSALPGAAAAPSRLAGDTRTPPPPPPGRVEAPRPPPARIEPAPAPRAAAVPLPERPVPAKPARPVESPRPVAKGSSLALWLFALVFVAAAAALYHFQDQIFGNSEPASKPPARGGVVPPSDGTTPPAEVKPAEVKPAEVKPADPEKPLEVTPPEEVLPAAAVREEAAPAEAAIGAPGEGVVAWTAPDGADVEAGAPVVKLQGFQKLERVLQREGIDRLKYYEEELASAKAANNTKMVGLVEKKVVEKKKIIAETEAALAPLVATAPAAGKMKVIAPKLTRVKKGEPVATIGGAGSGVGTVLRATFDVGKATYAPGPCMLAAKDTRDRQFAGVVETVDGGKVTVRIVTGAPVKAGDQVVLLPPK